MKKTLTPEVEKGRIAAGPYGSTADFGCNGAFLLDYPKSGRLYAIVSDGEFTLWEHVSVSVMSGKRLPTWEEMAWVKAQFWEPEECVVEFHPPESEYVDFADVLHLWKPTKIVIPTPPTALIGPKKVKHHH
jgi:hypothetical protein